MIEAALLLGVIGLAAGAVVYVFFVAAEIDRNDDDDDWRHA